MTCGRLSTRAARLRRGSTDSSPTRGCSSARSRWTPPYASYYLDGEHLLAGKTAAEVRGVYRQFGIELSADEKAPADHIRYLLAFLALMARRWEETGAEAFVEAYGDFRDAYVRPWVRSFQELVDAYAEDEYYKRLVALTVKVMEQ